MINDSAASLPTYQAGNATLLRKIFSDPHQLFHFTDAPLPTLFVNRTLLYKPIANHEGVGLARKIASDIATQMHASELLTASRFYCSDADVIFPSDYLQRWDNKTKAALFPFIHIASDGDLAPPLCLYEIFLRYHELGLLSTEVPSAMQVLGSTLAFTFNTYAQVRGFPNVQAGEDFHIVQKVLKCSDFQILSGAPLQIMERPSARVPFGTGAGCAAIAKLDAPDHYEIFSPDLYPLSHSLLDALIHEKNIETVLSPYFAASTQTLITAIDEALRLKSWQTHRQKMKLTGASLKRAFFAHVDGLALIKLFHTFERFGLTKLPWHEAIRRSPFLSCTPSQSPLVILEALRAKCRDKTPRVQSLPTT